MALPKNCARRTQKRCIQADVSLESHCADGLERGVGTRRRYGQQYGSGHALWGGWGEVRVHGKCAEGEGGTGTTPQGGEGCRIKHCHCTLKAGPLDGTDQTKIKKTFEAPHNTGAASICHLLLTLALCRTFVLRCVSIGLKLLPLCPKKRGALAVLHSTLGAGGPTPEGALRATLGRWGPYAVHVAIAAVVGDPQEDSLRVTLAAHPAAEGLPTLFPMTLSGMIAMPDIKFGSRENKFAPFFFAVSF